jgi:hypothetical protein
MASIGGVAVIGVQVLGAGLPQSLRTALRGFYWFHFRFGVVATLPPSSGRIVLMMEAARTSETLVNFYQTTRRYNPKESNLSTHRRENLKSHKISSSYDCEILYA